MNNIDEIRETYPRILELNEIVGLYEIHVEGIPQVLKIKILKIGAGYMGIANLAVRGKDAASPYRSLHLQNTKMDALRDAISGFFAFLGEGAEIIEEEDW